MNRMKIYIQVLCIGVLISAASAETAETDIYKVQNDIMQEIPAKMREQSLRDKQVINGCTVKSREIIGREAAKMHFKPLTGSIDDEKMYILVTITAGERKEITLGGGTLVVLYDRESRERIDYYRTR